MKPISREELARIIARQVIDEAATELGRLIIGRETVDEVQAGEVTMSLLQAGRELVASGVPYLLVNRGKAILCFTCGRISHHRKDVEQRYCGACHKFHDDEVPA